MVWADWEQRTRIIARTGWGKGARLLIPIIRALPGPALVASTEPSIFTQTVLARTHPERAQELLALAQADVDERWRYYSQLGTIERTIAHHSPGGDGEPVPVEEEEV